MYTDGLIEGRVGTERRRLDVDGLVELVEAARAPRACATSVCWTT